jgi:hypothetical protein
MARAADADDADSRTLDSRGDRALPSSWEAARERGFGIDRFAEHNLRTTLAVMPGNRSESIAAATR